MPNHVTNIINFDCTDDKFVEIAKFIKREDGELGSVDFNKLCPMPKELDISSGSLGMEGYKMYRQYLEDIEGVRSVKRRDAIRHSYLNKSEDAPKALALGKQYHDNIKKYGSPTWYEWCINNWGTKWNAYDFYIWAFAPSVHRLGFNTAWSSVPAIVKLLSEKYPEIGIVYRWADEDIGRNVGEVWYKGGIIEDINVPRGGSKEAFELSADIQGIDLKDNGFIFNEETRTYEWVDISE